MTNQSIKLSTLLKATHYMCFPMECNQIYTSTACNRTPESADYGNNRLICFGACNSIAIFDPQHHGSCKITKICVGHKARVNTVKWIKPSNRNDAEVALISGSDDGTSIIWDLASLDPKKYVLKDHTSAVTVVDAHYRGQVLTVATASNDSTIKLWQSESDEPVCFQTISLNTGFCFAVRFLTIPTTDATLLAFSCDDDKIHLYAETWTDGQRQFEKTETLVGHEDWVRCLDFAMDDGGDLLLASSSQDTFIRLWRISARLENQLIRQKAVDELTFDENIELEERIFSVTDKNGRKFHFALTLESVLLGHENWVYGVHWRVQADTKQLSLLSSSMDKTLIIWMFDPDSGVWCEKVRVGEVGGNTLGFFGGKFSPDGNSIVGHGFQGSFHIWTRSQEEENLWTPSVIVGGHFSEVRDLAWEPKGEFLYTLSADQTTRIHAPWQTFQTWHEIARPQVHGYDMQCLALLGRFKFCSGAEEKIVRAFVAPANYIENFQRITGAENSVEGDEILKNTPIGASVPSLGLSNKAVYEVEKPATQDKHVKDEYPENYFVPVTLSAPPPEETLMQNTLWPEVQKLYGHGFELYALAATGDGQIVASACRATSVEHAQIILWNTSTWKIAQKLKSHSLTVTQMKFSPDNRYLLSVSRDRRWSLFENQGGEAGFVMVATTDKKNGVHGRIIWCCDWSNDSEYFVTGSRDGKLVFWRNTQESGDSTLGTFGNVAVLELKGESITAVAFARRKLTETEYLFAVGLESGTIQCYSFNGHAVSEALCTLNSSLAHHLTVKKLDFQPNTEKFMLASCGDDHLVRINELSIRK